MATSAFKSTTKRSAIGTPSRTDDAGSSNRNLRRSRSLSRFSRRFTEPSAEFGDDSAPRGRFVNTSRGSGFPEICLDDLAVDFFHLNDPVDVEGSARGRSSRRFSEVTSAMAGLSSAQRRGRSVSRQSMGPGDGKSTACNTGGGGGKAVLDSNSRRRRSVSVVRCRISDPESDIDHSQSSGNNAKIKCMDSRDSMIYSSQRPTASSQRRLGRSLSQKDLSNSNDGYTKPTASSQRRLGRSLSQKDLSNSHDGYSSHSSALTDDEGRDSQSSRNMIEKTIRAVYAQKKSEHPVADDLNSGLYEVMRKELRCAVDEIKMELEQQAMMGKTAVSASDDSLQLDNSDVQRSVIRKNYTAKLEESEKRKQDLLAEIVMEEQRGRELSKIVRELLPDKKSSTVAEKPARVRKRSNDRNRMSSRLTEEAEKYFEDFLSNVEDTDISSFDGERSDASSSLGGLAKPRIAATRYVQTTETYQTPPPPPPPRTSNSLPVEVDGVILPWLQWETSNDTSPPPCMDKRDIPETTPNTTELQEDATQEVVSTQYSSGHCTSSRGSWSPDPLKNIAEDKNSSSVFEECRSYEVDMDRYMMLKNEEDLLFEKWREQSRIGSGGLLICSNLLF